MQRFKKGWKLLLVGINVQMNQQRRQKCKTTSETKLETI